MALALINEHTDNFDKALDIWAQIKSKEGCERTVTILKKIGSKDKILKYARWVFEVDLQTGLKLFVTSSKESQNDDIGSTSSINMSKDEVLAYLDEISSAIGPDSRRRTSQSTDSLKQKYLEWVTNNKNANEKYFTMLGEILIDNCFQLHPMQMTSAPKDKALTARMQL